MKLVAAPPDAGSPTATEPPGWHDLMTPLSRASRRRWTVVAVVMCAAVGIEAMALVVGEEGDVTLYALTLLAYTVAGGMLVRGTRRVATINATGLDERERASSGDAFRTAFFLLVACAVIALAVLGIFVAATDVDDPASGLAVAGAWILAWAMLLPTAVLAWHEPDALELDDDRRPVPEPWRDGLLGASLATGYALSLLGLPIAGLFAFAAVAATLGLLSLRVPGEPLLSWRDILVILFVVWLVGPTLLYNGCGVG